MEGKFRGKGGRGILIFFFANWHGGPLKKKKKNFPGGKTQGGDTPDIGKGFLA